MVFCVTCNSLRESKVCELDNFSADWTEVTMVETCVFVTTVTLFAASAEVWLVLLPAAPLAWKISHASVTRHYELLLCYPTASIIYSLLFSQSLWAGKWDLYFRCHMSCNYCEKCCKTNKCDTCSTPGGLVNCKILHSIKQEYHPKLIRLWKVISR